MTIPAKIVTCKLDPEKLRSLNAQISGEQDSAEPCGKKLFWIIFKVGGTMRLSVDVLSYGPGKKADVGIKLYRKISSEEYTLINEKIPDHLPLDREHFNISHDGKEYYARIESL
jgi:hypothetical protein